MTLRLQPFFAGLLALLTAALLALGSASAKPASGGYQLFEPVALEHQHDIQLSSLGNFDYHAKIASECCNAPNRTLTPFQQTRLNRLENQGVTIASPGTPIKGTGEISPLLDRIRTSGGTLNISRGEVSAQDLAALSRASGNEMAIFRDRATGQLKLRELGPQMGQIPENVRLIIHSQPGGTAMDTLPSVADRAALVQLNQRSSVIINSDGTYTVRFRPEGFAGDVTPTGQ